MSDEPDNVVLVHLRRIEVQMDRLTGAVSDLARRMTGLETAIMTLSATEASHYASMSLRMDRFEQRLDRTERRLDLTPA